jgi:hypothetical protein
MHLHSLRAPAWRVHVGEIEVRIRREPVGTSEHAGIRGISGNVTVGTITIAVVAAVCVEPHPVPRNSAATVAVAVAVAAAAAAAAAGRRGA